MNPNLTPYDLYKQAADALVPGQVGAGPNPGTTGQMDSDPAQASNTQMALQRFAQAEAPVLSQPQADAGAGYSTPAPGVSPSMQMHADVKAASVIAEAEAFAEHVYLLNKQAGLRESLAKGVGALNHKLNPPAPGFVDQARTAVNQAGSVLSDHAQAAMGHMQNLGEQVAGRAQHAQQVMQEGAASAAGHARAAVENAGKAVDQGVRNAVGRAAAAAGQHPYMAMGLGATGVAAAGAAGAAAGAASQKQASVDPVEAAYEAGRQFALQQIAQGNF